MYRNAFKIILLFNGVMNSIKRILVTGSNGCIGTRLCETLLNQGYEVVGVDIKRNAWNPRVDAITKLIDLRVHNSLDALNQDFDLIIHLAANPYVFNSVVNPNLAYENFQLVYEALEFARKRKVPRFMFSSSREVYGNTPKEILTEEDSYVKHCESPYTATKIGGEALIHSYTKCYDLHHMILRFSNVYGMYDESDRLIPKFIRRAKRSDDLTVFGKDKLLDFTHIDDLMNGILLCIHKFDSFPNNTFNLSGGQPTPILRVAELITENLRSHSKIILGVPRAGEVIRYVADLTKARQFLGYLPSITIEEGIKRSIDWYEKYADLGKE